MNFLHTDRGDITVEIISCIFFKLLNHIHESYSPGGRSLQPLRTNDALI